VGHEGDAWIDGGASGHGAGPARPARPGASHRLHTGPAQRGRCPRHGPGGTGELQEGGRGLQVMPGQMVSPAGMVPDQPNEGAVPAMAPVAQVSCRREGGVCR
jgi:hypothetical protein